MLVDSANDFGTFLYGTNSEHHVETSYRVADGAKNVVVVMAQNEFKTYGPITAGMCGPSGAMEVRDASNVHV